MKKLSIFLIIYVFILFNVNLKASTYTFLWENTVVYVNVGDNIANYLNIPKAYLLRDGEKTGEYVGILWGEDETDPDFIDTSKLGTYYLTYRAVSDIEETTTVSFVVCDYVCPEIELVTPLKTTIGGSINYANYFIISDNYYSYDTLKIFFDDSDVCYNKEGTYTLNVIVKDNSQNTTNKSFDVTIKGLTGEPVYEPLTSNFKIPYGQTFIASNYYRAYDASKKNITSYIEATLDTKILGNHKVIFSVTDDYNNKTSWIQDFLVYDDEAPTLELVKDRIEINIGEVDNLNKDYFLDLISRKEDNSEIKNIDITYSNVKKVVGEYEVVYKIEDIASNSFTKTLVVNVVCDSVPKIEVKDVYINVGESINYYNYFSVYDTYDGDITLNATIDTNNVDTSNEGIYFAYITVKNSYGKYNYGTITVHVKKGFISKYYWIFLIPVIGAVIVLYFVIKKKRKVI